MEIIIGIIVLIVAYLAYNSYKKRKADEMKVKHLKDLSNAYDNAYRGGDIEKIRMTSTNLVNSYSVNQKVLDVVYKQILDLLKENPQLKPLALEIGRKKYSKFRESGSPTVYDESAIMNDINASL